MSAGVELAQGVAPRVEGPQFLERFRHLEDFVSHVVSSDGVTTAATSPVADALSEDAQEWDFVVDAGEKGVVFHAELGKKWQPASIPDGVGGAGSISGDMSLRRERREADITEESISGGTWSIRQGMVCGAIASR